MEQDDLQAAINFDENLQIRLLDPEKRQLTAQLKEDCDLFMKKVAALNEIVAKFMEQVDAQRNVIEKEKLRAVGMRNKVKAMEEEKRKREKDDQLLVDERRQELARLAFELESLKRVKQEQELILDRLAASGGDG